MGNTNIKPHSRNRNKKQVHWKAADRPSPPGKPHLATEIDLMPDLVTIRWSKSARDGGSPITGYLVEHRRTGSPHWVRATPLLVLSTELTISGLEPGWRYQFRVSAENAVGLSDPSEISEPLTVTLQKFSVSPPKFLNNLKDVTVLENDKVEFMVQFIGQPYPKISWFKDGFEIFSSRRTRILTESDKSILTIHQSALSDEGEIKCTATNKTGHASTKAKLTLEAPPSIRLPRQYEDGLLFEIGEVIRLKVSVAGRPNPLVFWCHNGESIQNNDRYEIEYTDKCSILKLSEARRSDRGEYQIKAVNKIGDDTASFLVTVTDKPSPPGRARVIMTLGRSVTLSWTTPNDDGGCKIGNYIIEYYRLGWNMWLKAATSRYLTTILGDLIEGSEYKFRIKAESPYGVSEPSEESDIIFIPDPKRGITSPEIRSRSQPRDLIDSVTSPIAARRKHKPRSQSSTRAELVQEKSNFNENIYNAGIPKRPERNKLKSPPKTPDPSPVVRRKEGTIRQTIIDRASIARELSYGSPDIRMKKTSELSLPQQNLTPSSSDRSRSSSPVIIYSPQKPEQLSMVPKMIAKSPSPIRKHISNEPRSKSPSPRRESIKPFISSEKKRLLFKDDSTNISGSSEFMLVLYPDDNIKDQERRNSAILFDFDENSIPPPLSLSAPELGSEPPIFQNLKPSASSTELLHERAMMRFNEAVEAEEAELEKRKKINDDKGLNIGIPKIQINSKDNENIVGLEKKNSFRRRISAGGIAQQQILWAQRRYSLRNTTELNEIVENKLKKYPADVLSKRNSMMTRQRSESEEKEEEEFEKVRQKMALQRTSSIEKRSIEVVDEDKWLDDYEESLSEEETSSEDERYDYREDKSINMYSDDEEEVYHPGVVSDKRDSVSEEPFEILTKRNKLPDPNFMPKPILKKPGQIDDKIEILVEHNVNSKKIRSFSPIPSQSRERSQSLIHPEIIIPASKAKTIPVTKRQRSFSLIPFKMKEKPETNNQKLSPEKSVSAEHNISKVAQISGITAASIVIPQRLLNKKQDDEETKVVIDHYGDLVRSYSTRKKSLSEPSENQLLQCATIEALEEKPTLSLKYVSPERPVESMVIDMVLASKKSLRYSPTRELSPKLLQQRLQRSPSPRKRKDKQKREFTSKSPRRRSINSPVRVENWSSSKSNPPCQRKSSPSPVKQRNSPSPTILLRPRPLLKEIMTQTSIGLESNANSYSQMYSVENHEMMAKTKMKVRNAVDYITDLAMFCVACWLYIFDNELLAIPVLLVMIYRQLQNEVLKRIPKWILKKIKVEPQKK